MKLITETSELYRCRQFSVNPFPCQARHATLETMNFVSAILRLMSLCALLGMLVAPVSMIAAENAMAFSKSDTMANMPGMQGDTMPCCPDAKPVKPDCGKSCPLVIICTSSTVLALPRTDWSAAQLAWASHIYADMRFDRLASLVAEPPARPPKA
ncbi:MAG: hypothetical protein JWM58_4264 [Rhizobium sp.]|nr:hypothetical protein [Rhizobium sp.]